MDSPPDTPSRAAHLQGSLLGLVFLGGALGTAGRAALASWGHRPPGGWPWATLGVNLLGVALLAALLEALGLLGVGRPHWRVLLGTGVLGGFTSYSAFAVELVDLAQHGRWAMGLAYAAVSLLGGAAIALTIVGAAARSARQGSAP